MRISIANFEVNVPQNWLAQYTKTPTLFFIYSPLEENDSFQENCNLTEEAVSVNMSIKNYMDSVVTVLDGYYKDLNILEQNRDSLLFTGMVSGIKLKQLQYFYKKDNKIYTLTFSSTVADYCRYEEQFKQIASSFTY